MKKYLVATILAITVFAISAFAASLTVNAGVLQAGQGGIGQCVDDSALVVRYGKDEFVADVSGGGGSTLVDTVTIDHGGSCTDEDAPLAYQVVVTGEDGVIAAKRGTFGDADEAGIETVIFEAPFDAEEATDIHVVIRDPSPGT
jgi:hypothetical protein